LIELLVVISIIGLLAAIGLPAIKGIGQSNAINAATRQLADDLAFARQKAISTRSTVYMVFVPPDFFLPAANWNAKLATLLPSAQAEKAQLTNMISGQCSSYAIIALKTIGDQPGRNVKRYLTEWKNLPDGIIIAPSKFTPWNSPLNTNVWKNLPVEKLRPFAYSLELLPIPTADSNIKLSMPYIGFDAQGKLLRQSYTSLYPDEVIPLSRASVFFPRTAAGQLQFAAADIREIPPGNTTNTYRGIRVNWMTGRSKVEKTEISN
jgi:type II secretory pathway pseudopilin PulG